MDERTRRLAGGDAKKPRVRARRAKAPSVRTLRQSLTEETAVQVYQILANGKYRVGDRLPSEYELAEMFKVGRSAIREAIRELVAFGFLEVIHGRGTFVVSLPTSTAVSPAALRDQLRTDTVHELLELRLLLEPEVAALAAVRATKDEIALLRKDCVIPIDRAIGTSLAPEDLDFHIHLVAATHNRSLGRLTSWVVEFFNQSGTITTQADYEEHLAIVEAIERRDAQAARKLMRKHLKLVGEKFDAKIRQSNVDSASGEASPDADAGTNLRRA